MNRTCINKDSNVIWIRDIRELLLSSHPSSLHVYVKSEINLHRATKASQRCFFVHQIALIMVISEIFGKKMHFSNKSAWDEEDKYHTGDSYLEGRKQRERERINYQLRIWLTKNVINNLLLRTISHLRQIMSSIVITRIIWIECSSINISVKLF